MAEAKQAALALAAQPVEPLIRLIRGRKVMLDRDIAALYGVETRVLNQAVRRNLPRFPDAYMFQLTPEEATALRSQNVILKEERRGRHSKYAPYAFSEHGVVMLGSVLNSERAVQMSILVVNAFVRLREIAAHHLELASRLEHLERTQDQTVSVIEVLADDLKHLGDELHRMKTLPEPKRLRIGFPAAAGAS